MWEQTPAAEAYAQFICAVKRRSGRLGSIASGVVTQETTLEDSMRNDAAYPLQSLSPSVAMLSCPVRRFRQRFRQALRQRPPRRQHLYVFAWLRAEAGVLEA